jgi:L-iditol 2-dehydrogenase
MRQATEEIPKEMWAAILRQPGEVSVEMVPTPKPERGEVLLRVVAATTCGTDLKAFLRGHPQIPMPGPFGHEYSGIVAAVGEGSQFEPGQAVMGVHSAPCGHCRWCAIGQENLCETIMETKVLGSFAEYLLIPERIASRHLFPKPAGLDFAEAALLEPLACVAQALEMISVDRSSRVLVLGAGAIALMFVGTLRHVGCECVTLSARSPARFTLAASLGAETCDWEAAFSRPDFDLVIECTGSPEVWSRSLACPRRGGVVVWFGGCPKGTQVALDATRVHYDQITILSPFHFGSGAVRTALSWLTERRLGLSVLLSGERSLGEIANVFEDLSRRKGIKYVIRP